MTNFYPFLAYVAVTTFTPGPNNILSMTHAMRYGYRNIMRFLLGIFVGFTVVMLACGLLNVALVSLLPQVKHWLNLLGAAYMLYLAAHILFARPAAGGDSPDGMNSFKGGLTLQFLNLKLILYGVTVFSTFIVQAYQNPLQVSLFAPLLAGVGLVACFCWALGGGLFRSFLNRYERGFNFVMAALLAYTAVASLLVH